MADNPTRDGSELLTETVRIWDAHRGAVFVEGVVVAWTNRPTVSVRTHCDCGREKIVSHVAALPIDVLTWQPRNGGGV